MSVRYSDLDNNLLGFKKLRRMMMVLLPPHGRVSCNICFDNKPVTWGVTEREVNGWKIESNAGGWGSQNPLILVLGVSKGPNQTKDILKTRHEDIPFKGERPYLSKYLRRLELLSENDSVDSHILKSENDFAFGSMIRCGIGIWNKDKSDYIKVGNLVNEAANHYQAKEFVSNCSTKFLAKIPERLRLIVLLSNDDDYIDSSFTAIKRLHPDINKKNQVSYGNSHTTWVHIVHASGSAGRHREDWLSAITGKQASKRDMAIDSVRDSGVLEALRNG